MIEVSRLNGKSYFLNADLIKTIEETPDTVITLASGEKLMIREKAETLLKAILNYRKRIVQEPVQ